MRVDGHNMDAVRGALQAAQTADRPTLIACKTIIGYGAPKIAGTGPAHGGPYGAEEVAGIRTAINWPHAPFVVPDEILQAWRKIGAQESPSSRRLGEAPRRFRQARKLRGSALRASCPTDCRRRSMSTRRKSSRARRPTPRANGPAPALEILTEMVPEMVGGSADLTGSNNTRTASAKTPLSAEITGGRYVHWGIREHAMAAAMNGMALHGGIIPYSGTFLAFSDYSRPAIRLGALMNQRVIHVMTHDSIGVGEDGPTHQPVEHVASLRNIPNLLVFRPADGVESAEAWEVALKTTTGPSLIALTRQNLAPARKTHTDENLVAKGGYVVSPATKPEKVVLLATGSEVEIGARSAKDPGGRRHRRARCSRCRASRCLLRSRPDTARKHSAATLPKVAVEAGIRDGWDRWIGPDGGFVGMTGFGASAPYKALSEHFGITAEAVVAAGRRAPAQRTL